MKLKKKPKKSTLQIKIFSHEDYRQLEDDLGARIMYYKIKVGSASFNKAIKPDSYLNLYIIPSYAAQNLLNNYIELA